MLCKGLLPQHCDPDMRAEHNKDYRGRTDGQEVAGEEATFFPRLKGKTGWVGRTGCRPLPPGLDTAALRLGASCAQHP